MQSAAKSFSDLYHAHFDFVWRSLRRFGVSGGELDDAAQEVFLVLLRKHSSIDPERPVRAWLFAVVRRVASRFRRGHSRRARLNAAVDATPAVSTRGADPRATVDPIEAYDRREAIHLLDLFLDELTPTQREVFVLAELEQLSGAEISTLLETNQNTVWSRLRSARRAFDRRFNAIQAEHRRLHQHTQEPFAREVLSLSRCAHEPIPEDRRRVGAALGVPFLAPPGGALGGEMIAGGPPAGGAALGAGLPAGATGLAKWLPASVASAPVRAALVGLVLVGGAVGVDSLRERADVPSAEVATAAKAAEAAEASSELRGEQALSAVDEEEQDAAEDLNANEHANEHANANANENTNATIRKSVLSSAAEGELPGRAPVLTRMLASGDGARRGPSKADAAREEALDEGAKGASVDDPPAVAQGDLSAEFGLLTESREALASGDPGRGLERAEVHARRFPRGVLAQEREGLRITALCELGREVEAHRLADALRRQLGSADAVSRFTSACDGS